MGGGKMCLSCMELASLLQSYDGKRLVLSSLNDVNVSVQEVETFILFMQSWALGQCSCCFRDNKNFERWNWVLQIFILIVVKLLKNIGNIVEIELEEIFDEDRNIRPPWDIKDKDKLIGFTCKIFQSSFPTYIAYKQHIQLKAEEISQQEAQELAQYCEINDLESSPYLFRNVALFCKNNGLSALQESVRNQSTESLPLNNISSIVALASSIKSWLNFPVLLNFYVPFRSNVLSYLSKLVDTDIKTSSARNTNEFIWSNVKDPIDAHMVFDKDGLDLAFKYFLSTTLTMRLSGVTQITSQINLLTEILNSDHIMNSESLNELLSSWLIDNQIIEHIFGPNIHVEVIKQSNTILTYLAMEGRITKDQIDIMWAAAQLKHCSRSVYDALSILIVNLHPDLIIHLKELLFKLDTKDHTEASIYLLSNLTKFIWNHASLAIESPVGVPNVKYESIRATRRMARESSSENSLSVGGTNSDDEIKVRGRVMRKCGSLHVRSGSKGVKSGPQLLSQGESSDEEEEEEEEEDEEEEEEGEEEDEDLTKLGGGGVRSKLVEGGGVRSKIGGGGDVPSYVETHSDSDADGEKSGTDEGGGRRKARRKVLRRRVSKSLDPSSSLEHQSPKRCSEEGLSMPLLNIESEGGGVEVGGGGGEESSSSRRSRRLRRSRVRRRCPSIPLHDECIDPHPSSCLEESMRTQSVEEMTRVNSLEPSLSPSSPHLPHLSIGGGGGNEEGSEGGSYSSRMSTKSEKNMADFEGEEESVIEEDILSVLAKNQMMDMASRSPVQLGNLDKVFGPRPIRAFNARRRFYSTPQFNFQIETVCSPGQTLLWDLIQDDKITQLPDGLGVEAQKSLSTLLCFSPDRRLKLKFIEACISNLSSNSSVVVSLRLLIKLLSPFPQPRSPPLIYDLILTIDSQFKLRDKFFGNIKAWGGGGGGGGEGGFSFSTHLQVRLEFLSVLFSILTSPVGFTMSVEHTEILWDTLATDPRSSDEVFIWMCGQVRVKEQHALGPDSLRVIYLHKLPSLGAENVTMHALSLFQHLSSLLSKSLSNESTMDYLWKIALSATRPDVSMSAIQYLNGYYISSQLEREDEFIGRTMRHIGEATTELETSPSSSDEAPLLRIQRALLLLKTHLETFRRRYAYHLRRWELEGRGVGSHANLVGEKNGVPVRVVVQPSGFHEKLTLDLHSLDYVSELRAEVTKWWEKIQSNMSEEKVRSTPVLGSLLTEGPIRIITQGIELTPAEYDEKCICDVPIKDMQIVYVSTGASRGLKKKELSELSSFLPPPPRDKLPVTLLLQMEYFEQLFSLMQSLSSIKTSERDGESQPHTKAQVLSRRVWDILMLLPTNPSIHEGITNSSEEGTSFNVLLDPSSPQKLIYSLYIVEALVKRRGSKLQQQSPSSSSEAGDWKKRFVESGGLRHLFDIFTSGVLEWGECGYWSEWKQDCLASLLKILCFLGIHPQDAESLNEHLYDVNEMPRRRAVGRRRKSPSSHDKTFIPRLNQTILSMMDAGVVMTRLTNILEACSLPRDPNYYKTGFWGRAQVVHHAMGILVCWAYSSDDVRSSLYSQSNFSEWVRRLVLEDPEPAVRREVCTGLYRLCLGTSADGRKGVAYAPPLISHLLSSLPTSLSIKPHVNAEPQSQLFDDGKEPYGPACRDYFWLLGRLLDSLDSEFVKESISNPECCVIDLDGLAQRLSSSIVNREYLETRHNSVTDDALVGLLITSTVVIKHNPPFKSSKEGQNFLKQVFECMFALPSPQVRYLPKCKSQASRSAAFDLLAEMARHNVENYYLLQNLLIEQHQPNAHGPYPWDYWPHDDGRSPCGYVGLTNLGATCYMASCMQHLYMMPQARAAILSASPTHQSKHEQTLRELQRMFAYLMESERKAYNPRSFCKVYQMDHQPLNTGEQKDMAEFFIDLVSKIEEMTPDLQKLVKTLFSGVTTNNVVSLDCPHVSRTLEEFYTVRCGVSDMRTLFESLNEVTVKDTLEGDNMYTCSQCGKKVRAEKRACFKKLPKILCFNTMRYTFNMITMMKEKVNTHFSFPLHLDMSGYVEKTLMPQQYQEERSNKSGSSGSSSGSGSSCEVDDDEGYEYDLIGVTVHTGTADGGHYYSFIRDRLGSGKDKWYLFNDAEVKQWDPSQLAAECYGGEMNTKTYDSVTDKFMDFSFEKSNSAYMLFYERRPPSPSSAPLGQFSSSESPLIVPSLPGGSSSSSLTTKSNYFSSSSSSSPVVVQLSKELEDWIWADNTNFLRDKNIFEHNYINFISQVAGYIPQTLAAQEDVSLLSAKLSVTFFLETFIHGKEKPTMVQWVELLTKQLSSSPTATAWLLDSMGESSWWPLSILIKCPIQMVRQMFQRLCIHVIQQVRLRNGQLFMRPSPELLDENLSDPLLLEYSNFSCVTRFIKRLLSLLENGAKSYLRNLTEYFTFLHDFSKLGDEECIYLINMQAISALVNFYLGHKKDDQIDHGGGSEEEEEEEDDVVCIPTTEKSKVASLEKMIALVAILVEKSRDENNVLKLSNNDWAALTGGGKTFQFILQQIKDGINFQSTRNLIFSLCRWKNKFADFIIHAIFQAILKHPDNCTPFFKVLNLLAELTAMPPGMPPFTELILTRILDVADSCPYPTLEWLATQVPRNRLVLTWCLDTFQSWIEQFLIAHPHQRVRNAAATLLVSLVPNQQFRQGYRSTKMYAPHHLKDTMILNPEVINTLHLIYLRLLSMLVSCKNYADVSVHGTSKLTAYFAVLTYFTISKTEKLMFSNYTVDLWNLFHPKLSEPGISCIPNKQALFQYWHHVCLDCPENVQRIVQNPNITKQIGYNYILADLEDQEVVMFNRAILPSYYGILRMCCSASRSFASMFSRHQNFNWAIKNISPYPSQYPAAVEELMKLMQIFATRPPDATEQELGEVFLFRRSNLQLYLGILDGRTQWSTLITAFRILIDSYDERSFVVCNNGLTLLFDAFHSLHTMHHEATACHVTGEIVELLSLIISLLRTFRPKEPPSSSLFSPNDIQLHRIIPSIKDWTEVVRKLATLLNSFNGLDLRTAALDTLIEFLGVLPIEVVRTLYPLLIHCHSSSYGGGESGGFSCLGPYFPKRGGGLSLKPSSIRPPRPMLQMSIPHSLISDHSTNYSKAQEDEYHFQLREFYSPYHHFIDMICRIAFMKDFITPELINLYTMIAIESLPIRMPHFPKLWLEVYNTIHINRKYMVMLVNTSCFKDYIELILFHERTSAINEIMSAFLTAYIPLGYEKVIKTPEVAGHIFSLSNELKSFSGVEEIECEELMLKLLGDVKIIGLIYAPSSIGTNGDIEQPLLPPAPSTSSMVGILSGLLSYLKNLAHVKVKTARAQTSLGGDIPMKKRRLNEEENEESSSRDKLSLFPKVPSSSLISNLGNSKEKSPIPILTPEEMLSPEYDMIQLVTINIERILNSLSSKAATSTSKNYPTKTIEEQSSQEESSKNTEKIEESEMDTTLPVEDTSHSS